MNQGKINYRYFNFIRTMGFIHGSCMCKTICHMRIEFHCFYGMVNNYCNVNKLLYLLRPQMGFFFTKWIWNIYHFIFRNISCKSFPNQLKKFCIKGSLLLYGTSLDPIALAILFICVMLHFLVSNC